MTNWRWILFTTKKQLCSLSFSDTDPTFNFIVAVMYSQIFNLLCDKAGELEGGRLPVHVRFLLDEMANIGKLLNFE